MFNRLRRHLRNGVARGEDLETWNRGRQPQRENELQAADSCIGDGALI
jgi:hypothetical protein